MAYCLGVLRDSSTMHAAVVLGQRLEHSLLYLTLGTSIAAHQRQMDRLRRQEVNYARADMLERYQKCYMGLVGR
jgi:hypothetical protein